MSFFFYHYKLYLQVWSQVIRPFSLGTIYRTQEIPPELEREPTIPPYREKTDEPMKLKKARFASKYLESMSPEQVKLYDRLINLPSNDWDIYYWATGVKPTPAEFDNEIMKLLKDHVQNKNRESRIRQPDLY
ncbi:Succinate dehydrogenase assembly factor 2 [Blattella germanica]|nr:Succinate dehydrogenase assembly factor 2 [Blattella germanica]